MDKILEEKLDKKFGRPREHDDEQHRKRAEYQKEWARRNRERTHKYQQKPESKERRKQYRKRLHVKTQEAEYRAEWYAKRKAADPDYVQWKNIYKCGITPAQYREMLAAQDGHCATCDATTHRKSVNNWTGKPERLAVDHCHKTKINRGLMCSRCNTLLGLVGEDIELLERIITYLKRFRE